MRIHGLETVDWIPAQGTPRMDDEKVEQDKAVLAFYELPWAPLIT